MTLWMVWASATTALFGLAALATERTLRATGRPGRLAWLAAIAGALGLQAWSILRPPLPPADAMLALPAGVKMVWADRLQAVATATPALLDRVEPFLIAGWVAASAILALVWLLLPSPAQAGGRLYSQPSSRMARVTISRPPVSVTARGGDSMGKPPRRAQTSTRRIGGRARSGDSMGRSGGPISRGRRR